MSNFSLRYDLTLRSVLVRIAIIVGAVIVTIWAMPGDSAANFNAEQGRPWRYGDFTAPFDFPIYKSKERVKRERDSLMREYQPYYNYNSEIEGQQVRKFVSDFSDGIPGLTDDFISIIANRLHSIYRRGIISSAAYSKLGGDTLKTIRVVSGKNAVAVSLASIYSEKAAYEQLFLDKTLAEHRQALQRCNLNSYIVPNLMYDKERSDASLTDLLNTIPLAGGMVQKGQKIIGHGDIVSEEVYRILESFKLETAKRNRNPMQMQLTVVGETVYVALFLICFTIYLTLFRKDYFEKPRSIAMLYSLIVIFVLLTSVLVRNNIGHVYMLPYAMVPVFVRVFMDSRTAFITHFTMVMICACMLQYQFEFVVVQSLAGLVAIYSLRQLEYRSQLFKTALMVGIVAMGVNAAFDLIRASTLSDFDSSTYNYIIVNSIMLLFAYPLLYLMEKMFGFTSDITLIELSNTSNPLLRRMSEVAPGTFQHSIMVGNLAAAVANKIGAKSQLVRTGALYHDIGKMSNPIYFTENQSGVNPHGSLSSIDSAQIIISHVTEGLKMAEKANLPAVIKDFISTHHGLGKAKYFYMKYKNEHPDTDVDELLFTYIGPNPFTKEQAILMMADTVEAASRSLPDYTEKSIRDLVNRLIDGQLADGYFRECPITFRDIAYAKTVMIDKLKTMYHTRVSYPSEKA
ncbi:MAG: HDIG domain-containing protein [Prevotella sp.]|nr:HDIG domain-containing protein [Prevotella sp.]